MLEYISFKIQHNLIRWDALMLDIQIDKITNVIVPVIIKCVKNNNVVPRKHFHRSRVVGYCYLNDEC